MSIRIRGADFNLSATIESGQVFGFTHTLEGRYRGVLLDGEVELWEDSDWFYAESLNGGISKEALEDYFDLKRDLNPIYKTLKEDGVFDDRLKGLRIIQQNPWEALSAFVISSNNNIKRIKLIWNNLCCQSGRFPGPHEIVRLNEAKLRELGLGYRAPYLLKTARRIVGEPDFLPQVKQLNYEEAKEKLMELDGVGGKVADCVLLFGFQKYEAFPVDVWIARIMRKIYFRNRKVNEKRISNFAEKRWGALSGYIQQYLFHGARMGLI